MPRQSIGAFDLIIGAPRLSIEIYHKSTEAPPRQSSRLSIGLILSAITRHSPSGRKPREVKHERNMMLCMSCVQLPLAVRQNQAKIPGDTMIHTISKVHQWLARADREEI